MRTGSTMLLNYKKGHKTGYMTETDRKFSLKMLTSVLLAVFELAMSE